MFSVVVAWAQIVATLLAGAALWLNLWDRIARDRPNLRIVSGRIVLGRRETETDAVLTRGTSGPARLVNFGGGPATNVIVAVESVDVHSLGQYNVRPNHLAGAQSTSVGKIDLGMLPRHGPFLLLPNIDGDVDPLPSSLAQRVGEQIYAAVPEPLPMGHFGLVSRFDPQIEFRADVQVAVTYRDRTERRHYSQEFSLMMIGVCSFFGTRPGAYRIVAYLMYSNEATEEFILSRDERIMFGEQRDVPPAARV